MDQKSFWLGVVATLAAVVVLSLLGVFSLLSTLCAACFFPLLYAVKVYFQRGATCALAVFVIGVIISVITSSYVFLALALIVETLDAARHQQRHEPDSAAE